MRFYENDSYNKAINKYNSDFSANHNIGIDAVKV